MSVYRRKLSNGKRCKRFTAEAVFRGKVIRRNGFPDQESARHWLNTEMMRLRRSAFGYVKPMLKRMLRTVTNEKTERADIGLIEEFSGSLAAKGRDDEYAYIAEKRLLRLCNECGWLVLGDISPQALTAWARSQSLWRGKPVTARTKNQFIAIALEFGKWLASPMIALLPSNPLAGVERLPAKHNDRYRRAATVEEFNLLLATCAHDRQLYYLFRIYTPMRADTIGQLSWEMMHLDAAPPFAMTPAEMNKSRREEKHTIRYEIAQKLRAFRKSAKAKAHDLVFPNAPDLDDFKADLAAAGVQFELKKNFRRLDYHALRKSLVRLGKGAGLSLEQCSTLLGHKDIRTTQKYYDDDSVDTQIGESLERLPTLGEVRRAQ